LVRISGIVRDPGIEKTAMTMITNVPRDPTIGTTSIRAAVGFFLRQLCCFINHSVASAIARRERQAERVARRYFHGKKPNEVGVHRYQIGAGPADNAEMPPERSEPS
jgi:hypothetical protein